MKASVLLALSALVAVRLSAALEAPPTTVQVIGHAQVDALFAKGGTFLANSSYKVMAGRHDKPGAVEVHTEDTDVFYIVQGSATFTTGGTILDAKTVSPGEIRGRATTGGTPHHLEKGDVIVIPKGVPHWFNEVEGPFLYFVVKVKE